MQFGDVFQLAVAMVKDDVSGLLLEIHWHDDAHLVTGLRVETPSLLPRWPLVFVDDDSPLLGGRFVRLEHLLCYLELADVVVVMMEHCRQ